MTEVTRQEMEAWLMDALAAHLGGRERLLEGTVTDRFIAQRLARPLTELVNSTRREGGPTCSSCDEPSVVKLGRTPFCVAHFGEAMRGLRAIVAQRLAGARAAIEQGVEP